MTTASIRLGAALGLFLVTGAAAFAQAMDNPPSTAVGRAVHRAVRHNSSPRAQNLRNNSASRAVDRAAGTNNSGAYPAQSDGMPGNPPGTAVSRALGTTNR